MVFDHFDFLLQVLQQEADPGGSVWVRYLKLWNWDGKQAWKWEDTASYLMEYRVPAANVLRKMEDVLRKMEDVHLHDNGRNSLTLSTNVQVSTQGLGEKVFSFLTASVLFFIF